MNEKQANDMTTKLKEAKSAEEFFAVCKEYGAEATEEQAKELFERMHAQGELSDDALESAAGGVDWGYVDEQIKKYGPDVARALCSVYGIKIW